DLHVHANGSFDVTPAGACPGRSAAEQIAAARAVHLDFVALTEHDHDPRDARSYLTPEVWRGVVAAAAAASDTAASGPAGGFVAFPGYEWTSSYDTPFGPPGATPDCDHKIVVLPPGAAGYCGVKECADPDALAAFVERA